MADLSSGQPLSELSNCKRSYYAFMKERRNNLSQLPLDDKQFAEKKSFLWTIGRNIKEKGRKLMSKLKGV